MKNSQGKGDYYQRQEIKGNSGDDCKMAPPLSSHVKDLESAIKKELYLQLLSFQDYLKPSNLQDNG